MNSPLRAAIRGTGFYVPDQVLTNERLASIVDTSDEWIFDRTGIRERRIAAPDQTTAIMASTAAERALLNAGMSAEELDLIIVCTITPDYRTPSSACLVQHAIGADRAAAFDVNAACAGYVYGVTVANGLIASGMQRNIMVIGADVISRVTDYTDRSTCILFGDGAGATIYTPSDRGDGVAFTKLYANGALSHAVWIPAGGCKTPLSARPLADADHYLQMEGRTVFRFATNVISELLEETMASMGLTAADVSLIVPHQVNRRILETAMDRVGIPIDKCFINIERYGNTSAASIPIAIHEAREQGKIQPGDRVLLLGFGAGLTWGSVFVQM